MPPKRREIPACAAAAEKVGQTSVTSAARTSPGSTRELPAANLTEPPKRSLPVNSLRISAPAALNVLCPEDDPGHGRVGNGVGRSGNHASPAIGWGPRAGHARAP